MSEARRLKSRAGCIQCKRRKVKCDQSLPGCQQCSRQKLKCPGYQKPLKWIDNSNEPKATMPAADKDRQIRGPGESQRVHSCLSLASIEGLLRLQSTGLPKQLNDESSALVQHYFTRVCKIAGCFDSEINPFRIIASAMMAYSKPVSLLLQASSAAQLSRQYPTLLYKALSLQAEAFSVVRTEIANLRGFFVPDELMICSIFAGLTSSWYDVNDLGSCHVLGSQVLLSLWLMSKRGRLKYQQTFILGAYVYWLAISAFVTGDPKSSFYFQETLQKTIRNMAFSYGIVEDIDVPEARRKILPHPLTGFSIQTFLCVGKVGSLCRWAHAETVQNPRTLPPNEKIHESALEQKAKSLEIELLSLFQGGQNNFQDPQDPHTTIDEILGVGEAYRCAGLLQLYMTFPQLLQDRSNDQSKHFRELHSYKRFMPSQHNWLRSLAFHILSILETIPPTSGTRVLQGLPVLIAATWFVDPVNDATNPHAPFEHPQLSVRKSSKSKVEAREIVSNGLRMHAEYVGLQQVSRVLEILEEVWRRDDEGPGKCDWIVVVTSKGLQTLYG